eukprot:1292352-Amphidinium_carterae.2
MTDGRPVAVWCMQHDEIPVVTSAPVGEQYMTPGQLPACAKCGTYHEVVGCNYEGCLLGWCPSHAIYVSGLEGGFWCLRHKDNIPLENEFSIIERPLGFARTYCVTCSTEVWPAYNCQPPECLSHYCENHFVMHEKGGIKLSCVSMKMRLRAWR